MDMNTVAAKYEELFLTEAEANTSVICQGESEMLVFAEEPIKIIAFMLKFGKMFTRNENGWLVYDMAQ